ncbi:MAG: hypothetical protein VX764_10365 [Planctomycetota bacterium]|nr:hypothetical protein [Planctomycetota bacterium]
MTSARRRPPRSGSRRAPRGSSDDGIQNRQPGEKPIYQPPAKKTASPVVVIITLVLFVGSGIFFAYALINRDQNPKIVVEETTTDKEYKQIQVKIQKSEKLVREVYQMRNDPDSSRFVRKWSEANKFAGDTFDQLRAMVAGVRLPNGTLPPEYSGYNSDFTRLQFIMGDLSKMAPLDFDWDSEE